MRICTALLMSSLLAGACQTMEPYTPPTPVLPMASETHVSLIHFADYHSHAVPYYSEHMAGQGGIARALAYVQAEKAKNPDLLVLNGGDMVNAGTPAWSDKYSRTCAEWKWWDGLVTAMALGNHDVDYGWSAFQSCQLQSQYPVLSGNLVDAANKLLLPAPSSGKPYVVQTVAGLRIGLFALSGPDFTALVKPTNLPAGAKFSDALTAAQTIVHALRNDEKVDAVIFFGHQDRDSDFAMAKQVPGIDLILGTHSHYKGTFQQIPGTQTYFISPFQYLNYLSQVDLLFRDGKLAGLSGKLVRMSADLPEDAGIAATVAEMEAQLEADPIYAPRFAVIGQASVELDVTNADHAESILGDFVMDIVRTATPANAAFSTSSSFRASIPPGAIRMEDYLTALPYTNKIKSLTLTGADVQALLDFSASKQASDNFAVTSGLRYTIAGGKAVGVSIARDPMSPTSSYDPLNPATSYTIMATDYISGVAAGYKDIFAKATMNLDTGKIVNDTVITYIRNNSPVSAKLDGRIPSGG